MIADYINPTIEKSKACREVLAIIAEELDKAALRALGESKLTNNPEELHDINVRLESIRLLAHNIIERIKIYSVL